DTDSDGTIVPSSIVLIDPSNSGHTGSSLSTLTIAGEGRYSVDASGNLTFTPEENFNGVSSLNYRIKDNLGATSNVATVDVTITPVNDGPVAIDDEETMSPGATLFATVVPNDIPDPEGDNLTYSLFDGVITLAETVNDPLVGDLIFNSDGTYQFIPVNGFLGDFVFQYEVCDDGIPVVACTQAIVSINVSNNLPPVADNDDAIITEDNPVTIFVINGDTDEDGTLNPFEIVLIDPVDPAHTGDNTRPLVISGEGTYTVDPLGNVTFTPEENYTGTSIINYTVEDNLGAVSNVATITIIVTPANDPPVAVDDQETTDEDTPVTIAILDNDSDPESDVLEVTEATTDEGTVVINSNGTITLTPNTDFVGEAIVNYTITDSNGGFDDAIVTITIVEDRAISIVVNEVCINDTPFVDYTITPVDFTTTELATIIWRKLDGTVVEELTNQALTGQLLWPGAEVDNDGNPIAWPGWDFIDGVWIQINDGLRPEMELVISVNPENSVTVSYPPATPMCSANPNNPPLAVDDEGTTDEDTPVTVAVLDNDSDIDGDELEVTEATTEKGTVVINVDGTITFTPTTDFVGEAIINYTITDGDEGFDDAIVTITITEDRSIAVEVNEVCISNTPYVDYTITPVDFATTELATIIWRKLDGTVVEELTDQPLTGQLLWPGAELDAEGNAIAWPGWDFIDGVWIQLNDGLRPEMELVISVNPETVVTVSYPPATPTCSANPNNPPVAIDDELVTDEDTPVTGDLVENDFDREVDDITIKTTPITSPTNGTVVINIDGTFTYIPNDMFNGVDSFVYEICDNGLPSMCAQATSTIIVGPVNDPPVAMDDEGGTDFETPVTGDLVGNDEDPDGDNLTVTPTPVTPPSNGTLVLNPGGSYTYTPEDGFVGTDTFVYQVCDDGTPSICDEATVTITVNSTNQSPVAVDDENITDSITPAEGNVLDNDSDPDGDNLTVNPNPISNPINGTLILNPDGSYVYTPDPQFEGTDSFEYEVCDNGVPSLCTIAEVVITVELPPLDIPQIFGGANNPSWFIEGIDEYPDNHVQVFNRWGNKVFEIKGYDNNSRNWASESNVGIILGSNLVPDGTYFYVIDLGDGSKPMSGFVVVNR
ncbi:MAG: CshA-type fibril repeat protein, partial [Cyclobacteriaceae bacterium]